METPEAQPATSITPPRITPAAWEDFPVFRETFLLYFTEASGNAALRTCGRLLHELVLEYYHHWPSPPETFTVLEVRAALADLRQLQGFLEAVGREPDEAVLTPEDTKLSRLAARQAGELERIAGEIERELAKRS